MYCAFYFYCYCYSSFPSAHQALDPGGWGPLTKMVNVEGDLTYFHILGGEVLSVGCLLIFMWVAGQNGCYPKVYKQ